MRALPSDQRRERSQKHHARRTSTASFGVAQPRHAACCANEGKSRSRRNAELTAACFSHGRSLQRLSPRPRSTRPSGSRRERDSEGPGGLGADRARLTSPGRSGERYRRLPPPKNRSFTGDRLWNPSKPNPADDERRGHTTPNLEGYEASPDVKTPRPIEGALTHDKATVTRRHRAPTSAPTRSGSSPAPEPLRRGDPRQVAEQSQQASPTSNRTTHIPVIVVLEAEARRLPRAYKSIMLEATAVEGSVQHRA